MPVLSYFAPRLGKHEAVVSNSIGKLSETSIVFADILTVREKYDLRTANYCGLQVFYFALIDKNVIEEHRFYGIIISLQAVLSQLFAATNKN